jgi:hypothetical protein
MMSFLILSLVIAAIASLFMAALFIKSSDDQMSIEEFQAFCEASKKSNK